MRLIDADDLIITILTHDLCDTEQIDKDILEAPTVEAIPIEWIKKYVDDKSKIDHDWLTWGVDVLHMLEDWEKENETNRRKRDITSNGI